MANPSSSSKEHATSTTEQFKESASQFGEKAKDTASHVADKAKEAASNFGSKAREAASAVGDMVGSAASTAGSTISKTAERATSAAGSSVRQLGDTIREKGPQEGVFGGATRAVANTLHEGGKYLEQEGLSGMMEDVTQLIRRNPVPAIFVGLGIGFLIGRTLRS